MISAATFAAATGSLTAGDRVIAKATGALTANKGAHAPGDFLIEQERDFARFQRFKGW
jgi:hypothetical protein